MIVGIVYVDFDDIDIFYVFLECFVDDILQIVYSLFVGYQSCLKYFVENGIIDQSRCCFVGCFDVILEDSMLYVCERICNYC